MRHLALRRKTGERGAALVEFALLLPLLLMLLIGIVSVGVAYNHQLSLTHGAREATRYAATLPVSNFNSEADPMAAWLEEVADRAIESASGSLDPGTPGWEVCVAYVHPNGTLADDSTTSRTETESGASAGTTSCFVDGRPNTERRVQVVAQREVDFNVVVFTQTLTLDAEAASRYEAALGG